MAKKKATKKEKKVAKAPTKSKRAKPKVIELNNKPVKKVKSRKIKKTGKSSELTIAIIALVLNIVILPGLGTLLGRKIKIGALQIILSIVGIILSSTSTSALYITGLIFLVLAWVWGLLSGIRLIKESSKK